MSVATTYDEIIKYYRSNEYNIEKALPSLYYDCPDKSG